MGGQKNFTPLIYQLAEQERRGLPPGVLAADPGSGMDSVASMSDPETISDDEREVTTQQIETNFGWDEFGVGHCSERRLLFDPGFDSNSRNSLWYLFFYGDNIPNIYVIAYGQSTRSILLFNSRNNLKI